MRWALGGMSDSVNRPKKTGPVEEVVWAAVIGLEGWARRSRVVESTAGRLQRDGRDVRDVRDVGS